jgi:hypothetical protein
MLLAVDTVSPGLAALPLVAARLAAALVHGVLPVISRRGGCMNACPYATRRHLHEISKVRLRIPTCLYEINETTANPIGFTRQAHHAT